MTSDLDKLQEVFDNEVKDFINGIKGLQKKESEANEEKGVSIIKFVKYFVTWSEENKDPKAPLFLSPISIKKSGNKYNINISNEFQINQVLLQYFKNEYKISPSSEIEELLKSDFFNINQFEETIEILKEHYSDFGIKNLTFHDKSMFGYFNYTNLPMVSDLDSEEFEELLSNHELGEAISTVDQRKIDKEILEQYQVNSFPEYEDIDDLLPSEEYLVLDADSSQQLPVLAAGNGFHLVVQGPPGTGKSQTIANMISYCASIDKPKKILFVSEKRAAIDAVLKRLEEKNLEFLILDMFTGLNPSNKRKIYTELSNLTERGVATFENSEVKQLDNTLPHIRKNLNDFAELVNAESFEELENQVSEELASFNNGHKAYTRLLSPIENETIIELIDEIKENDVSEIKASEIEEIVALVQERSQLIKSKDSDIKFLEEYLLFNKNFQEIEDYKELLEEIENISKLTKSENLVLINNLNNLFQLELRDFETFNTLLTIALELNSVLNLFKADVFTLDIEDFLRIIKENENINNKNSQTKVKESKNELLDLLKPFQLKKYFVRKKTIVATAKSILEAKTILEQYGFDFSKVNELTVASNAVANVFSELDKSKKIIEEYTNFKFDKTSSIDELVQDLSRVINSPIVKKLDRLAKIYFQLEKFELNYFKIYDLAKKSEIDAVVRSIYLKIQLNKIFSNKYKNESKSRLELIKKFMEQDGSYRLEQNLEQIKKKYDQNLEEIKSAYPEQLATLKREANKQRRQANIRKVLEEAEELMLGVKPCWVMSPLVASQILPRKEIFDIVIFDEASQVTTPAAITAIARGKKLVVAGDSKQLPPTNFFKTQLNEEFESETQDFSSILDIMDILIPAKGNKQLQYHYRSKDERLITISNVCMNYDLKTIPGLDNLNAVKFLKVNTKTPSERGSNPDEVLKVCEEISSHMETNPERSLVVVAFGSHHMQKIEEVFYREYEQKSHILKYIQRWENTVEPFRIKNLETVQGDERDTVILSIGYGRNAEGKVVYRFGPINQENGNRRLNVAASRAKEEMIIISTLSHEDLEDSRLRSEGPKMFKELLKYFQVEYEAPDDQKGIAGLQTLNNKNLTKPPMNPIEKQIQRSIERMGYIVESQFGASGYFIDFVIAEKSNPGKWLLAVEFDGARYHSSKTARDRDRLRQMNLERFGWKFFRIWSTDWFNNKNKVLEDLEKTLKSLTTN